jgi:hypothetical protein
MAVTIRLPSYNNITVSLPRQALIDSFPQSLLAQALGEDPTAEEIIIENPIITPQDLQTLADYLQGIEPLQSNPHFREVDRYLNIPLFSVYADPLYDEIYRPMTPFQFELRAAPPLHSGTHKTPVLIATNTEVTNWSVFVRAWYEQNWPIIEYLVRQGFDLNGALIQAINEDRINAIEYLLTLPEIYPDAWDNQVLITASWRHRSGIVKQLLKFPGVTATAQDYEPILVAIYSNDAETLAVLLDTLDDMPWAEWELFDADIFGLCMDNEEVMGVWETWSRRIGKWPQPDLD